MDGLKEELEEWKKESERALSKLETKQGDDKSNFLKSLGATKGDVEGRNSQNRNSQSYSL